MSEQRKVVTKIIRWNAMVRAVEGKPEKEVAYEFSNGRKFYREADPYKRQREESGT